MSFVGKAVKSSSTVELQGIRLEKNLNFESHIENYSYFPNSKFSYTQTSKSLSRDFYETLYMAH